MKDGALFYFAGLWEVWRSPEGKDVRTVTLVTTEPHAVTQPVHDRMPVILPPENRAAWLAADTSAETLKSFLVPYDAHAMKAEAVSTPVNSARYDGPDLIRPLLEDTFRLE